MWGSFYARPAVGLGQILEIYLRFYNTADVRRMKCGVKFVLSLSLSDTKFSKTVITAINFINTASVRSTVCGAKKLLDPLCDID